MSPKIMFKYSRIYDEHWKELGKFYGVKDVKYPAEPEIRGYIKKAEKEWRKSEGKILAELSKMTGLKWKDRSISCYVVGRCIPISDPLTLKVYEKLERFVDVLTHELIHQLLASQEGSLTRSQKAWDDLYKKYKNESFTTVVHVPVHALHKHILLKFFQEKRLNDEVGSLIMFPDYKRAWDVVEKEGYLNIIKEFTGKIKK